MILNGMHLTNIDTDSKVANGIAEHYLYYCPKCKKTQSLKGKDAHINCMHCGKIASFDETSQLNGPYPSLVEWEMTKKDFPIRLNDAIQTEGRLYEVDVIQQKKKDLGYQKVTLENQKLKIKTKPEITFEINEIQGEVITRKHNLSFDYGEKTYNFLLKDPMIILNAITYIKEN